MTVFDRFAAEYDSWYDLHPFVYQSELEAIRRFIPSKGHGVEIGVGTGRFSVPFSVSIGVEPSEFMAAIARSRGITVHLATAERLPFPSARFEFALMVNTLCFVNSPDDSLQEIHRILKPRGLFILAFIDRETPVGKLYEEKRAINKFYSEATFHSSRQVINLLRDNGFIRHQICQTVFSNPENITGIDSVRDGYGEGAFVVIGSFKQSD
jgi:ubiquinone/menaquinone biosynthesis C-methylase UbiE